MKAETERCRLILAELNEDAIKLGQEVDDPIPILAMMKGLVDERFEDSRDIVNVILDVDETSSPFYVIRKPELIHPVETILDNAAQFANAQIDLIIRYDEKNCPSPLMTMDCGFVFTLSNLGNPYNSSRAGSDGHMGLGIFITITMVEQIGGKVVLENRKIGGASVGISYPRESIESKRTTS